MYGTELIPSPKLALISSRHGWVVRDKVEIKGLCRKRVLLCADAACVGRCNRGKGREMVKSVWQAAALSAISNCLRFTSRNSRHLPYLTTPRLLLIAMDDAASQCLHTRNFTCSHHESARRFAGRRPRGGWPTTSRTSEGQWCCSLWKSEDYSQSEGT